MKKIQDAQLYLQKMNADGWLIYDFHGNNELGRHFLEIPLHMISTRRFFYWIPAHGDPIKLVHAIEPNILDSCPGEKRLFLSWQSLRDQLRNLLKGAKRVAMEYSPDNMIPYVSRVDAGTVDLIRSFEIEVVSSGGFLPHFTAVISDEQGQSHIRAGRILERIVGEAWIMVGDHLKSGKTITDSAVQQKLISDFTRENLVSDSPPIVAVNSRCGDPHYANSSKNSIAIRKGDFLLIDIWAKENKPKSIYGDITHVAVAAERPTEKQKKIFNIVRSAQIAATELVVNSFTQKKELCGWEVDECARTVIREAGYGEFFIHRTGHNIGESVHGSGANMDNLEMHDVRPVLLSTCFSIEPGIYLPGEFGVRLEYDLYVHQDGRVEIVGGAQDEIVSIL